MKIRLWGTADECRQMAQLLMDAPGFDVVSVSEPYADRGASVLVRVFVEARLDTPPVAQHVTATSGPAHGRRKGIAAGGER
jgi:hypothetical protein